ncbi:MAG: hypothetical protein KKH94_08180 [Candidatus Omnitrophica bacterium]|nr:hypothetical protein [Candidatus Omnitrophota bacterium]
MKTVLDNKKDMLAETAERITDEEKRYIVRRGLNYALWAFENYPAAKPAFVKKARQTVYEMLPIVRTMEVEIHCVFIYWILHEISFHAKYVEKERIATGIFHIEKVASYFNIEST